MCRPPVIRVSAGDADDLAGTEADVLQDSLVVFRAYQQTSEALLTSLARTFPPGTPVVALKGRDRQVELERQLITESPDAHPQSARVYPLPVPGGVQRSALVWRTADRTANRGDET
jgi:hypothetical protein